MKKTAAILALISMNAFADKWDSSNDPRNFDNNYEYRLNNLPLSAELPSNKTPWSSSYWPRKKGSINYRWNSANPTGYIKQPSEMRVRSMSRAELATLSPAEKFDLVQGNYNYPLSANVLANSKPSAKDFEGVCDGWTAAAIEFVEPAPVDVTNPDGIVIPFGSSDVKALMSYDVSINFKPGSLGAVFVGGYCSAPLGMTMGLGNCKDINPGAFHVILANQIGLKKQSFAVDVDPGRETWNQPVHGFEFKILERTSKGVIVNAKMKYAADDLGPEDYNKIFNWDPIVGTVNFHGEEMEVDYELELDYSGRIIGGSWIGNSKRNHPDLFWMPTRKIEWTKEFDILNKIYKPAF